MIENIKYFLEALKFNMRQRAEIVFFGIIVLCLRPFANYLKMVWFYDKFTWLVVLITIAFISTLFFDFCSILKKKYDHHVNEKNYEEYILGLTGRKLEIVNELYKNKYNQGYFRQNDTNIIELVGKKVICQLKNQVIVRERQVEDINDPEFLFILQPAALEVLHKYSQSNN